MLIQRRRSKRQPFDSNLTHYPTGWTSPSSLRSTRAPATSAGTDPPAAPASRRSSRLPPCLTEVRAPEAEGGTGTGLRSIAGVAPAAGRVGGSDRHRCDIGKESNAAQLGPGADQHSDFRVAGIGDFASHSLAPGESSAARVKLTHYQDVHRWRTRADLCSAPGLTAWLRGVQGDVEEGGPVDGDLRRSPEGVDVVAQGDRRLA